MLKPTASRAFAAASVALFRASRHLGVGAEWCANLSFWLGEVAEHLRKVAKP